MTVEATAAPGTDTAATEKVVTTETTQAAPATETKGQSAATDTKAASPTDIIGTDKATGDVKQVAPANWPDNWRDLMAGDDKQFRQQLDRYASPNDVGKKARSLEQRLSSGEFKKDLPKDAKPEEIAAWKKENGYPEKAEEYLAKLELPKGVVLGEADKPLAMDYAAWAVANNVAPADFNKNLEWYYSLQDKVLKQQQDADAKFRQESEDALRSEWGGDFRKHTNLVNGMLAGAPEGLKDRLVGGRTADGRHIGSDPQFIKWMANLALEINPALPLIADSAGGGKSIDDQIAEIRKFRQDNPDKYDSDKAMQARELSLIEARMTMQKRNAA